VPKGKRKLVSVGVICIFSDEDFRQERELFKQFEKNLGQKVGIILSKDIDGARGGWRKSAKDSYIEKLWSNLAKAI
jgi:hypothetical protein